MKMSAVWEGLGLLGTSVLPHPVLVNIPAEILAQGCRSQELGACGGQDQKGRVPYILKGKEDKELISTSHCLCSLYKAAGQECPQLRGKTLFPVPTIAGYDKRQLRPMPLRGDPFCSCPATKEVLDIESHERGQRASGPDSLPIILLSSLSRLH